MTSAAKFVQREKARDEARAQEGYEQAAQAWERLLESATTETGWIAVSCGTARSALMLCGDLMLTGWKAYTDANATPGDRARAAEEQTNALGAPYNALVRFLDKDATVVAVDLQASLAAFRQA